MIHPRGGRNFCHPKGNATYAYLTDGQDVGLALVWHLRFRVFADVVDLPHAEVFLQLHG